VGFEVSAPLCALAEIVLDAVGHRGLLSWSCAENRRHVRVRRGAYVTCHNSFSGLAVLALCTSISLLL